MAKKATATDPDLGPQDIQEPPNTGPTSAVALDAEPDPPVLPGHEGEPLDTVTLIGGGPGDGVYRVAAPMPMVVVSQGARYVISDRAQKLYVWQR